MALVPLIPNAQLAGRYARAVGFDDVYCDGPYPMFFSGIMAKGRVNPFLLRYLRRSVAGQSMLREIQQILPPAVANDLS